MHASTLLLLAVAAGLATAQTTTSSSTAATATGAVSGCGSQIDLIIASCLGSTQPQLLACPANDWDCMCTQSINVLTCYNNCPSSPDRFGFEQTKVANCNAASAYGTSSKTTAKATGSSATGSTSTVVAAASTTTSSGTSTRTESASASDASATESGVAVVANRVPVGGILAAVFGFAALL